MSNAYTSFKNLIGKSSTDVVTIVSVNIDGTSRATTLSGATITLKGDTVPALQKAFVRDGEILSQAPNITIVQLEV